MAETVFYSWQSDLPNNTNRGFIEKALSQALKEIAQEMSVEKAARPPLAVDKDTDGVPGSPPIADTILAKISECRVFIPDLSFVASTKEGRPIPNPNVLIEYGWALSRVGNQCILPVVNAAYGEPDEKSLPFDLRHLRWPICYNLGPEHSPEQRERARTSLIAKLRKGISAILDSSSGSDDNLSPDGELFMEAQSGRAVSTFLGEGEPLGEIREFRQKPLTLYLPENQQIFLRLSPTEPTDAFETSKAVLDVVRSGSLRALCFASAGFDTGRNKHGAFVVDHDNGRVLGLTQVFKSREIWGIDAFAIDLARLKEHDLPHGAFFPSELEEELTRALDSYLTFAVTHLNVKPPFKVTVGASGVKGYRMSAPRGMHFGAWDRYAGSVVEDDIQFVRHVEHPETPSTELLRPFFERLWEECGLTRPDKEVLG